MLQVAGITDSQREQVEALEGRARERFFQRAQLLREVRRTVMKGWPADPDSYEGPLNSLVEEQQRHYADLADVLTPTQRNQLNQTVLSRSRDRGFIIWNQYMKGYATTGSFNPAFQPF